MENLTQKKILSSSSGWVAVVLNLLPGLGTGYIYQRRWKAYWLTGLISFVWLIIGTFIQSGADPMDPIPVRDSFGLYGLLLISVFTAFEAGFAVKAAR